MSTTTVGTCSICGGRVTVPTFFHSIIPAVPTCEQCGAEAAQYGQVIPMKPAPRQIFTTTTNVVVNANYFYPQGTDLLWMAHYSDSGDMDGPTTKLSGTIEEAAKAAQKYGEDNGLRLQCLRRRY